MSRRAIVAANWKMNGDSTLVDSMFNRLQDINISANVDIVICPSYVYLADFSRKIKKEKLNQAISVGAQNISQQTGGAFTGEVSPLMLQDF